MTRRRTSRLCAALAGGLLVTTLTGCGPDPSEPEPTGSPDPSGTTTSPSDPTDSTSPTESQSSSVPPATGVLLKGVGARVRAPEGWKHEEKLVEFFDSAQDPRSESRLSLSSLEALGQPSLQELAEASIESGGYLKKPRILDPVVVDGVECYHVVGPVDDHLTVVSIGTIHAGQIIDITLSFDLDSTTAEARKEVTESVWATVQWV
jgi:hypothetical protein